jgi:hypothetical protein
LGAFDAILMGVFWLNHKLGVEFVGIWLDNFWWFGWIDLVLILAFINVS